MELFNNDLAIDDIHSADFDNLAGEHNPLGEVPQGEYGSLSDFSLDGYSILGDFPGEGGNPMDRPCRNFPGFEEEFLGCNEKTMGCRGCEGMEPGLGGGLGYPGCGSPHFHDPLYQAYGKFNHLKLENCGALLLVFKIFIDHKNIIRGVRFFHEFPFSNIIAGLYSDTGNLLAASCPFSWQEHPFNVPFTRHVRVVPGYAQIALLFKNLEAAELLSSVQQFCNQFPAALIPIPAPICHLPSSLYDVISSCECQSPCGMK